MNGEIDLTADYQIIRLLTIGKIVLKENYRLERFPCGEQKCVSTSCLIRHMFMYCDNWNLDQNVTEGWIC